MPKRTRLYPYRVVYIDAVSTLKAARKKLPIYTDIVIAKNSAEAKMSVVWKDSLNNRSLFFLTSTRHPDSKAKPELVEFKKLTPTQLKSVEKQIAKAKGSTVSTPAATASSAGQPDTPVEVVAKKLRVKKFVISTDPIEVGIISASTPPQVGTEFTGIDKVTSAEDKPFNPYDNFLSGRTTRFTSTAPTVPLVAPIITSTYAKVETKPLEELKKYSPFIPSFIPRPEVVKKATVWSRIRSWLLGR